MDCRQDKLLHRLLISLLLVGGISTAGFSQDIHFSQFYESAILRNPALMGFFEKDFRVVSQYRSQWNSISSPFQTGQLNAEAKFSVGSANDVVSIGALGYYDRSGAINLKTIGVYPSIAYHKSLSSERQIFLSVGFTGGFVQRSVDVSRMTFDNQYGAGGFSASIPSGENISNPRIRHWDLGAGINFSNTSGANEQLSWFIGVSGYHFSKPKRSFLGSQQVSLDMRWNGNFGCSYKFSDAGSVQMQANYARQGSYQEIIVGGICSWQRLSEAYEAAFKIGAGLFYRVNDGLVPVVKVDYRNYSLGVSYDVNLSQLRNASKMRGGYELMLAYSGLFQSEYREKARTICPGF